MSNRIIPFGYSVPGAMEHLNSLLQDDMTMLVDIRYSNVSQKKPEWSGDSLRGRYGKQYLHIKALGNKNYFRHGFPIEIANLDAALPRLLNGLQRGYTLILLCTCDEYERCHRKVIVDALLERMPDVEVVQPGLFVPDGMKPCISIQQPFAWIIMGHRKIMLKLPKTPPTEAAQ